MRKEEFDPKWIRYCIVSRLADYLDYYVKDTEDPDYQLLKKRLMEAAKRSEDRNPFGAGRPERFDEEDKKYMLEMKNSGRSPKSMDARHL
jgi:hypothetical protein